MEPSHTFRFTDYDCIGFDLDNTLARYKIGAMIEMEYKILSEFLVKKGYSKKHLLKPVDYDFLLRGLVLDIDRGNILKLATDGKILRVSHGTRLLTNDEVEKYYPSFHWELTDLLVKDPLEVWNGPYSENLRSLLDYFDIVVSLLFARAVDSTDEKQGGIPFIYDVYSDILEGLIDMFNHEHFELNKGGYFPEIKSNPDKYYYKCSKKLTNWLTHLKNEGKLLFLITGSYVDFASLTASYTLGPNWRDYFSIIITYAKKPGFFNLKRDFIELKDFKETSPVTVEKLELGNIYTHGNWDGLQKFLTAHSLKSHPKFLYIGDSIIQDVYAPCVYCPCDTVAVCEEMDAQGNDEKILNSTFWGSYIHENTFWYKMMKDYTKICVSNLDYVAERPLEHDYKNIL